MECCIQGEHYYKNTNKNSGPPRMQYSCTRCADFYLYLTMLKYYLFSVAGNSNIENALANINQNAVHLTD